MTPRRVYARGQTQRRGWLQDQMPLAIRTDGARRCGAGGLPAATGTP
jgi:hypothetical protein